MKIKTKILAIIVLFFATSSAEARVDPEKLNKIKDQSNMISSPRMSCQPSKAEYDMEVNNVRARLLTGGDIWWNLQDGRYIVPKPAPGFPEVSSIFAGGVWVGGVDPNGALKLAGVTYRTANAANNNTDFYPGPLDENGLTNLEVCTNWDEFFVVKGENVLKHIAAYDAFVRDTTSTIFPCDSIPEDVLYWPGRGNEFWGQKFDFPLPDQNLGNFWDEDGDGNYEPCGGDFPVIDIRGCAPDDRLAARELLPDEMVFWVYNDNGGNHVLSGATAIQMEIQVQSFAYATNDEINDMTFYRFKLINRASDDIRDCYFAMWTDPDLGCSEDDYIGCDVGRSMGYVYNEDAADGSPGTSCPGGVATYELNVPILGIDYFRGPRGPKVYQISAEGDTTLVNPEPGSGEQDILVELGMTSFLYQNRGVSTPPEGTQDPDLAFEFYNILKGQWKDGTAVTFGGSGFDPASVDSVNYVFPDPPNDDTGWSMCTADLPFDDRRTVQATGPLLLQPGAKNELIIGAVFVPNIDYPCPDISRLQFADDLAQTLFDNCFNITDGPDAPDMYAVELDRQLILLLSNDSILVESNNAFEEYKEKDLRAPGGVEDIFYRFEGYQVYQLAHPNVSVQELDNVDLARLIRQVDVKNDVEDIYNWFPLVDPDPSATEFVWVPERQVVGDNKGIRHSFNVTIDQFANTDRVLVNHKNYYFTVLAYGYNNYLQYDTENGLGQRNPFIEGRKNVKTYTFTPRPIVYQDLQTAYGQEAAITRIEGVGTGFNALELEDGEVDEVMAGSSDGILTYKAGNGPINAKVVDPLNIKNAEYRLEIVGEFNDASAINKFISPGAKWNLTNITTGEIVVSEKTIEEINEQIIYGEGFSISVNQVGDPGDMFDEDNGAITQVFEYADANETNWWNAVPGFRGIEVVNPDDEEDSQFFFPFVDLEDDDDPRSALSQIDDGHFIPLKSARWISSTANYLTPAWKVTQGVAINQGKLRLKELNNVDLVFTSNKSKWSKCIVIESAVPDYSNFGLATVDSRSQFELRADQSIDMNGDTIPDDEGMSYFPGYAVDIETGERLNIFFGENSVFSPENDSIASQNSGNPVNSGGIGSDMIWNPSGDLFTEGTAPIPLAGLYNALVGGQHYIYITRQEYDECAGLKSLLESGGLLNTASAVGFVTWTALPLPAEPLLSLEEGLIPNDLTVKLRVTNPFNKELNSLSNASTYEAVGELPVYEFGFLDVEAKDKEEAEYSNALDNVQVVPNPYYAYSAYEQDQFENIVKVTNLPPRAVVTIFTLDGKFIQQFNRDAMPTNNEGINPALRQTQIAPAIEWNLKNNKGIPVASGVYLFHISAPDLGIEKTVKWFGVNRRFDPTGL